MGLAQRTQPIPIGAYPMKQLDYFVLFACLTIIICVWMFTSADRHRSDNETKVELSRSAALQSYEKP